jgi:hypothetical protein
MKAVVVGGHTRNIGKTSVMSALIREFAALRWTAVKITQYGHGICSRDGHACDCAPEEHPFALTEETDALGRADTCRFLAAGAEQSLWLRVREGQIVTALPLLNRRLRQADWVIIESNSILDHMDPLLYLAVLDTSQRDFKPSAQRALGRADALVLVSDSHMNFEGVGWPHLDRHLLNSKPVFRVARPAFWDPALGEFLEKKLGPVQAANSGDASSPSDIS